jgi:hypothetical protein
VFGVRLTGLHVEYLDAHGEVEVPLIGDLPILSGPGSKLDQKGMDEQTIFSIEIEPETAVDVNEWAAFCAGGNPILTGLLLSVSRQ